MARGAAVVLQLDQRLPGLDVAVLGGQRPVDEVEVDVVEPEPVTALLEGAQRLVVAVRVVVQLGGDEDLVARQAGLGDRRADARLVAVHRGGVDVPVAGLEARSTASAGLSAAVPGTRRSRAAGSTCRC